MKTDIYGGLPEGHALHLFSRNDKFYPWIYSPHLRAAYLNGIILSVVKLTGQN